MPIPFIVDTLFNGLPQWLPHPWTLLSVTFLGGTLYLLKSFMSGRTNTSERDMHGRVVMITGGTSGIGAATARAFAERGAQILLLTRLAPSDAFLADYIGEMRKQTGNELIYAEQVDLTSLHSIRQFATKWIDNAPPRRLDTIVLCASTLTPPGKGRAETSEGVEETWMVNYVANFHLLAILSPAIRAQPFDRDVRIVVVTCSSYIWSPPLSEALDKRKWTPSTAYARSKLALSVFGRAFQKHLDAYKRPDELPMNARVVFVDPGLSRTPGMRRWLTRGTVWGLLAYLASYIVPWFLVKSAEMGAQSILYAVMEPSILRGTGGKLIKECMEVDFARLDVKDEEVAKQLWESTDQLIEKTEKRQAGLRALEKQNQALSEKKKEEAEKAKEVEALAASIRKGRNAAKAKAREKNKQAN